MVILWFSGWSVCPIRLQAFPLYDVCGPSRRAISRHEPPQPLVPLLPFSFIRVSARFAAKLTSHECVSNQAEFGAALSAPLRYRFGALPIAATHRFFDSHIREIK
jgi:hypothetical protein